MIYVGPERHPLTSHDPNTNSQRPREQFFLDNLFVSNVSLDLTMIENIETVLRKTPLFASLSESEFKALASRVSKRHAQRGELLFGEGDPCKGLYLVVSGKIRIFKVSAEGREQVLAIEGPGARSQSFRCLTAAVIQRRLRLRKMPSFCSYRAKTFRIFAASIPRWR